MPSTIDPLVRNSVHVTGKPGGRPILFAHGFGGSKDSWRFVAPEFESDYSVVLFDFAGSGDYDRSAYDRSRYDSLNGFADDVIDLIDALGLDKVVFVGHSVSAMVGVLAANQRPELFERLILLGPSPRYVNEDSSSYVGGFEQASVDDLLHAMDSNFVAFSASLAPILMGPSAGSELTDDLAASIRSADPEIARQYARATFLADNRRDLADVTVPVLILQSGEDNISAPNVGRYVHDHIPGSRLEVMATRGHVPHLSSPEEVTRHLRAALL